MRFRYAFQKIVDLKGNEKTQAEWMLSDAIGKMKQEEFSLMELEQSKLQMQDDLHRASEGSTTVSNLLLLQGFVDHIQVRIESKHKDLQQAMTVVQLKQDDLTGKMLEEKIWMKAKEKAYHRFNATMLKQEQEQLDEMATNRYKRLS